LRSVDESWSQITAGTSASNGVGFAIRADKLLFTWGYNITGILGTGDTLNRSSPTQLGSNSWLSISASEHVLAIRSDQTLWVWGAGPLGKLGLTNTNNRSSPTQLGSGTWSKVAAGASNSYGITTSGLLYSWGAYLNGALGNIPGAYPNTNRSSPVQVGSDTWNDVYAGRIWAAATRNI
jgi:alpha-tubulin suppressor-like RCC1 family protein